jgi:L-lactate dehydrogenase complex protein LldG
MVPMHNNQSRNEILERIAAASNKRLAFVNKTNDSTADIYKPIEPDAVSCFKNELESISGKCYICKDDSDQFIQLKSFLSEQNILSVFCRDAKIRDLLEKNHITVSSNELDFENMEVGITTCDFLIARTGSIIVNSATPSGRQMNVFPPIHVILANTTQLHDYPENAYITTQEKYRNNWPSTIATITGPSRTADIEKTLVLGAHGPKELVVFLSNE